MKNEDKIILDLAGGTGAWSKPYKDAGYTVINVTLPEYDVRNYQPPENVYGVLAAPPCTMFSDARTRAKSPRNMKSGFEIVKSCLRIIETCQYRIVSDQQKYSPLKFWCLENPWYGRLKWFLGNPVYVFDPWEFGDAYKKKTALWGYFNLPVKTHATISDVMTKEQIEKHKTNSQKLPKFDKPLMPDIKRLKGVNNAPYWKDKNLRQTLRSITPEGFAKAFYAANR